MAGGIDWAGILTTDDIHINIFDEASDTSTET